MKKGCIACFAMMYCLLAFQPVQAQIKLGKLLKEALSTETPSESTASEEETVEVEVDFADENDAVKNEQPTSFVIEVEELKKGKSRGKTTMKFTADTWKTAVQTSSEDSDVTVIFDNKKGTMLTITESDGERSGVEIRQPKIRVRDNGKAANQYYQVTKTGETKTIEGAVCEKYLIEHEDGLTTAWVTDHYEVAYNKLIFPMLRQMKNSSAQMEELEKIEGIPVESHTVSKDGKTETMMYIKNIKSGDAIDRSVFEVSDVEVMSLNFGF